jgi:hypothetical protein
VISRDARSNSGCRVRSNFGAATPKHRLKPGIIKDQKTKPSIMIDNPVRSAKPPSPVQIRAAPPIFLAGSQHSYQTASIPALDGGGFADLYLEKLTAVGDVSPRGSFGVSRSSHSTLAGVSQSMRTRLGLALDVLSPTGGESVAHGVRCRCMSSSSSETEPPCAWRATLMPA